MVTAKLQAENKALMEKLGIKDISELAELSDEISNSEDTAQADSESLMTQVANWLTITEGRKVNVDEIFLIAENFERVSYRRRNDPNDAMFGILKTEDGKLSEPYKHEHSYRFPMSGGLADKTADLICVCDKKE